MAVSSTGAKHPPQIKVDLPLPPSTNALYERRRGGGLALSDAAKLYRERVNQVLSSQVVALASFPTSLDDVYELDITIYRPDLENAGWFTNKQTGERGAKTRFKVFDVDNCVKFLKDCLARGIGIGDDCQFFRDRVQKVQREGEPFVRVVVSVASRGDFGIEER